MWRGVKMDLNNEPGAHKMDSGSVLERYFYDVEKKLYNIAINYMSHSKQMSMGDQLDDLTGKN